MTAVSAATLLQLLLLPDDCLLCIKQGRAEAAEAVGKRGLRCAAAVPALLLARCCLQPALSFCPKGVLQGSVQT